MLDDGTIIGCRYCSQCIGRSVDDWTGRCIAESIFAVAPYFVGLTYGRDENGSEDHIRARLLTYSDVQKYMKRLRASGYCPRYFCVGEYGSTKGRAHWHLIIFWKDNSAEIAKRLEHNELVRAKLKRGKTLNVPEGPVLHIACFSWPPMSLLRYLQTYRTAAAVSSGLTPSFSHVENPAGQCSCIWRT